MKRFVSKDLASRLIRLIVAILVIIPVRYFFCRIHDSIFIESAMGNWFATMIGALVGVGIALELYRWQERQEQEARRLEERERKIKILKLVWEELKYNQDQLLRRKVEADGQTKRVVVVDGLKDELWNALSDGGELEWIKDLQLLDFISRAYHYIRRASYLEELYLRHHYYPGTYPEPRREEGLLKELVQLDDTVLDSIEKALEETARSLADLGSVTRAESIASSAA